MKSTIGSRLPFATSEETQRHGKTLLDTTWVSTSVSWESRMSREPFGPSMRWSFTRGDLRDSRRGFQVLPQVSLDPLMTGLPWTWFWVPRMESLTGVSTLESMESWTWNIIITIEAGKSLTSQLIWLEISCLKWGKPFLKTRTLSFLTLQVITLPWITTIAVDILRWVFETHHHIMYPMPWTTVGLPQDPLPGVLLREVLSVTLSVAKLLPEVHPHLLLLHLQPP